MSLSELCPRSRNYLVMIRKQIFLLSQRESVSSKSARPTINFKKRVWKKGSQCLLDLQNYETRRELCPNNHYLRKTFKVSIFHSLTREENEDQRTKELTLNPTVMQMGFTPSPVSFHALCPLNHSQDPYVFMTSQKSFLFMYYAPTSRITNLMS